MCGLGNAYVWSKFTCNNVVEMALRLLGLLSERKVIPGLDEPALSKNACGWSVA